MTVPSKDRRLFSQETRECKTGHKRWNVDGCNTYTSPDSCEAVMVWMAETGSKNFSNETNFDEATAGG